jgi:hypothetical protein
MYTIDSQLLLICSPGWFVTFIFLYTNFSLPSRNIGIIFSFELMASANCSSQATYYMYILLLYIKNKIKNTQWVASTKEVVAVA